MIVVSFADACRRLSIDAKTRHRWLTEAELALHNYPHDGRKKGLSEEHLHTLARLHHRRLAGGEEEVPAPLPCQSPALPADLLKLPEQLAALQAQIAALQQQVAELTRLVRPNAPAPALPLLATKPTNTAKRPAKLILPTPHPRRATK